MGMAKKKKNNEQLPEGMSRRQAKLAARAAERAARWAGAKTKQRRQQAKLDPALVARAKTAADRITGREVTPLLLLVCLLYSLCWIAYNHGALLI